MNVNDLVVQGAEPLFFLDYFASGKLDVGVPSASLPASPRAAARPGCALIGGETAEMPGLYAAGDYDLAGFAVGAVERAKLLPRRTSSRRRDPRAPLLRRALQRLLARAPRGRAVGPSLDEPAPFARGKTLGEALIKPTRIYVRPVLQALRETNAVKALAHITGGGLTENIPRVLPDNLAAEINLRSFDLPPVFRWLQPKRPSTIRDAPDLQLRHRHGDRRCAQRDADAGGSIVAEGGESPWHLGRLDLRQEQDAVRFIGSLTP